MKRIKEEDARTVTKRILGYDIEARTARDCIAEIANVLRSDESSCHWMACINPHSYAVGRRSADFKRALRSADWLVPDGVGILIAGCILGQPLRERITGFDIFHGVMQELDRIGGSVFFLGGTEETLGLIAAKLPTDYPSVRLAGTYSPPFNDHFDGLDNELMLSSLANAKADVLWVGMTAPKQEKWIAQNLDRLPVSFAGAIGAVFDFYTGKVKRSHPVFQRMGLEWLPRLVQQPRRLWRRMLVSAPVFLADTILERLGLGSHNNTR